MDKNTQKIDKLTFARVTHGWADTTPLILAISESEILTATLPQFLEWITSDGELHLWNGDVLPIHRTYMKRSLSEDLEPVTITASFVKPVNMGPDAIDICKIIIIDEDGNTSMEFPAPFVKVVMHSRDPETGETKIINPDEEN